MKIENRVRCIALFFAFCLAGSWPAVIHAANQESKARSPTDKAAGKSVVEQITGPNGEPIEGIAKPDKLVELRSPIVATVDTIEVEEAQHVETDQLLIQLADALQKAAVERARLEAKQEGEIAHARAALDEAKLVLDNTQQMRQRDAATEYELKEAEFEKRKAQATLDAAVEKQSVGQAALQYEMRRLEQFQIRAPFAGYVIKIDARDGSTVSQQQPVITIARLDPLRAEMHLPAPWYTRLHVGDRYLFKAERPVKGRLVGRCDMIEPMIDSASGTFRCVFVIDNPQARLPAGFMVQLLGPVKAKPAEAQGADTDLDE